MATLGKFTIPKSMDKAGKEEAKAEGTFEGINKQFYAACLQYKKGMEEKGHKVEFVEGTGFLLAKDLPNIWNSGKAYWQGTDEQRLFEWGLGVKINVTPNNDNQGSVLTDSEELLNNLGLKNGRTEGNISSLFPKSVWVSDSADKLSYEGDNFDEASNSNGGSNASVSSVAYFFTESFTNIQSQVQAYQLTGERALANDKPLWDTVKQVANSSLRSICSDPKGRIVAFYPDYFGIYTKPIMILEDIDLIDLKITQSDDTFFTHIFCPGVNHKGQSVELVQSLGVVTIEDDASAKVGAYIDSQSNDSSGHASEKLPTILEKLIHIPEGEEWKYTPKELFRRYGARPKEGRSLTYTTAKVFDDSGADSENPTYILPYLMALYEFMYNWAEQNKVNISITFQPALYPGCRIRLKSFDVEAYIKQVSHSMSYTGGFTTNVEAICPTGTLVSGMVNIKEE